MDRCDVHSVERLAEDLQVETQRSEGQKGNKTDLQTA
jgi:hypothetical protein